METYNNNEAKQRVFVDNENNLKIIANNIEVGASDVTHIGGDFRISANDLKVLVPMFDKDKVTQASIYWDDNSCTIWNKEAFDKELESTLSDLKRSGEEYEKKFCISLSKYNKLTEMLDGLPKWIKKLINLDKIYYESMKAGIKEESLYRE